MARANVSVSGKESVKRYLKKYKKSVRTQVAAEMTREMGKMQDAAREILQRNLKQPNESSGNLSASIQPSPRTVSPADLTGSVGSNLEYAAINEFGFTGTQRVSAHKRTITQAFGEELDEPKVVSVEAHTRRVDREGKYFLTKAAQASAQRFPERLTNAIQRAN